jgi:cell division protein FtsZ
MKKIKKRAPKKRQAKPKSKDFNLAKIKVVGVGGGGGNAVSRMCDYFPRQVEVIAINTDLQDLEYTSARKKIHIGKDLTRGLGTGMNPDIGRQSAEENREEIADALKGADMVFITAGFGGGTGTGATPVVAEVAKELGLLTVAIVTKPFTFEGAQRTQIAQEGLLKLRDKVDTLITIPNDRIFSLISKDTSLFKAFEEIDEVLKNSVSGITEMITSPGMVNVDFADVRAIMQDAGSAIIGIGRAGGQERSVSAAGMAVNSPLLESSIEGARGILFSISGHRDLKMSEINDIAKIISENVDPSAKIIFGTYYDRKLKKGQIKVTLVATGFDGAINGRNSVLLPELLGGRNDSIPIEEDPPKIFGEEEEAGDFKKKKTEEGKKDKGGKKDDEIWDIPTFLRKKRRN